MSAGQLKTTLTVVGLDAATWTIIRPNLKVLPNFASLISEGKSATLTIPDQEAILSPPIWCSMLSGKSQAEHGHTKYVVDDRLVRREDIGVKFAWDVLWEKKIKSIALQIPFVMPPYNFNCDYKPVGLGVSSDLNELDQDTTGIAKAALKLIEEKKPFVFMVGLIALDRLQHFHWGESIVIDWYRKMDQIVGELNKRAEKIIVISDHGFCGRGEAKKQTLPDQNEKGEPLKGDHHQDAILITRNIKAPINEHKDLFDAILKEAINE